MTDAHYDPINRLLDGFARFREKYFQVETALFEQLATVGQSPKVAVVACCDSRVDPAIIMDCAPGDLFTIRNVANLVPPYEPDGAYHGTSAALEFAVRSLLVEHIIVLGHAQCGGIHALLTGEVPGVAEGSFISSWMDIAAAAREQVLKGTSSASPSARAHACELAAIGISLRNLMTFPWLRGRVEQGALHLHGWYFDLGSGEMQRLNTEQVLAGGTAVAR